MMKAAVVVAVAVAVTVYCDSDEEVGDDKKEGREQKQRYEQ